MYERLRELGITPEKRRSKTLANWWRRLNCWEWPKELGEPEDRDTPGCPRRNALMKEIIEVLGVRKMKQD